MEINPQSVIIPDAPLSNHTIRVDIQWSPASLPGWIMYYDLNCDQNNYSSASSTTGSNTFSLTSPGYENYQIQLRFGSLDPNQPTTTGTYQLYYDEQLIRSASFQAQPASYSNFAYFNTHYQSPVLTDYTFSIYTSEICPGRYEDIYLTTSRNCNATAEINTELDSITLTIETGREFVSFYKNSQKKDTVTFMFNELGSIYLRQDSTYIGSTPLNINIKSDWTGIIKYQQLVINPQEQFQIRVPDQPIIVFSGGVGGLKIETYNSSICPPYISENLKYTALIKKGSSRGLLYDYDTGQSGDTLTNLTPQEDGEKYLDFITEGEILNEEDTVLIKIFSNNENIDTTEAVIFIHPNEIDVQIIPSVISQGDTASVVLKKRGVNGLEDFAPDKVFNVEIVQGLEYGLILDSLSNDTLTTFSNIPQGFKIIAKDSTGIDSTRIRIKVSTEESFFPSAKMLTVDKYKLHIKESDKEAKEEAEVENDKTIIPNFIIPGTLFLEGYGDVVVKKDGDWCDSLIICNSNEYLPNIILNQVPNGYSGTDLCKPSNGLKPQGVTQVYWTDTLYTFNVSVCFSSEFQKLWFNINDGNSLKVNYTSIICDNLPNDDCNLIDNWMGFPNTLNCDQLEAIFIEMYKYGSFPIPEVAPCFFLKNVILAHENEHVKDYQFVIDKEKLNFAISLDSVVLNCSSFENMKVASEYWITKIKNEFEEFKIRSKYSFSEFIKSKGGLESYEDDVQRRMLVKSVISNEIILVNNFFGCLIQPLFN